MFWKVLISTSILSLFLSSANQATVPSEMEELTQILEGVANYCQRLKKEIFHFVCQESIIETAREKTAIIVFLLFMPFISIF